MSDRAPAVLILGTRGIPAAHGGFETFAERFALYMASRGWRVGVYCQKDVDRVGSRVSSRLWEGVELITVEVGLRGPAATLAFDAICAHDAAGQNREESGVSTSSPSTSSEESSPSSTFVSARRIPASAATAAPRA